MTSARMNMTHGRLVTVKSVVSLPLAYVYSKVTI